MGSLRTTPAGYLYFDFRFRGIRCREYTTLKDSLANRTRLEQRPIAIEAQIAVGTFDYRAHFPQGRRAALFAHVPPTPGDPGPAPAPTPRARAGPVEYLTTDELSQRIKFSPRYIRERLKGRVLREGVHYVRPFGRKVLFIWDAVERLMHNPSTAGDGTARRKGRKTP